MAFSLISSAVYRFSMKPLQTFLHLVELSVPSFLAFLTLVTLLHQDQSTGQQCSSWTQFPQTTELEIEGTPWVRYVVYFRSASTSWFVVVSITEWVSETFSDLHLAHLWTFWGIFVARLQIETWLVEWGGRRGRRWDLLQLWCIPGRWPIVFEYF